MSKALEIHKGDLVTPSIEYMGHGHVFVVTEVDVEKRRCYIKLFRENIKRGHCSLKPESCKVLTWCYMELDLIRTIESINREWEEKPYKNANQIKEETARKYINEESLPSLYGSREVRAGVSFAISNICSGVSVGKFAETLELNNEKGEQDMLKILELYKMKEMDLIREKHEEMRKSIVEIDEIQLIIKEMENQVKAVAGEEADAYSFDYRGLYEDRTKKALKEIDIQENRTIINFNKKIEQIQALLELAPNYEEKIKILRDYEIMDRKKNIIL